MHHTIKTLFIVTVIFSLSAQVWCMHLTQASKDVVFVIAHLLLNQEDEPFDYYNCASKENTHTQQSLNLFKKYELNVTTAYIYLMRTCKYMYGLLHLENQLPVHLNWHIFIKSVDKYIQDDTQLIKMTSDPSIITEKYSFEFLPFDKYIQWKLRCDFFQRSSRGAISKKHVLEKSFIDRRSSLWDTLDFLKKHSFVGTIYTYSFKNFLNEDNTKQYIEFTCTGLFDWVSKGVPLSFVKEYFLET